MQPTLSYRNGFCFLAWSLLSQTIALLLMLCSSFNYFFIHFKSKVFSESWKLTPSVLFHWNNKKTQFKCVQSIYQVSLSANSSVNTDRDWIGLTNLVAWIHLSCWYFYVSLHFKFYGLLCTIQAKFIYSIFINLQKANNYDNIITLWKRFSLDPMLIFSVLCSYYLGFSSLNKCGETKCQHSIQNERDILMTRQLYKQYNE